MLDIFFLVWFFCFCGVYFIINNLIYFIDCNIITLNGRSIIMTLFDDCLYCLWDLFLLFLLWLCFTGIIICLVIWILLVYFIGFDVCCVTFLITSPNVISILLGWDGLGFVSYLLVIYYQNVRSYGAGILTVLSNPGHQDAVPSNFLLRQCLIFVAPQHGTTYFMSPLPHLKLRWF